MPELGIESAALRTYYTIARKNHGDVISLHLPESAESSIDQFFEFWDEKKMYSHVLRYSDPVYGKSALIYGVQSATWVWGSPLGATPGANPLPDPLTTPNLALSRRDQQKSPWESGRWWWKNLAIRHQYVDHALSVWTTDLVQAKKRFATLKKPHSQNWAANSHVPQKRSASADDYEDPAEPKPRKKRNTAGNDTPAVDPPVRPQRTSRMEHPGMPDAPRAKRTHEEVEAARAAEAERLEQANAELARQRAKAIADIVAIDAEQDKLMALEKKNRVLTLADMDTDFDNYSGDDGDDSPKDFDDLAPDNDITMEFNEQQFERIEDEEACRSQNEFQQPKGKGKATGQRGNKVKKPLKGETRREIEAAVSIRGQEAKNKNAAVHAGKKKGVQNSDAAAASKNAGISKHWAPATSAKAPEISPLASPGLGGLNDEDAAATRPEKRLNIPARRNEVNSHHRPRQ
ncbi:hypothetical protein B0H10DRAFT_1947839 [Mycena sp. CBHHK59/15]|nr:hypothetical protein B0H10DRAFT_1947839 [Mycena sp. CBHHK59/15]